MPVFLEQANVVEIGVFALNTPLLCPWFLVCWSRVKQTRDLFDKHLHVWEGIDIYADDLLLKA